MFLLRLLLLCALVQGATGCAYFYAREPYLRYHLVRVTNIEGELIAEWVAEGFVARTDRGYRFKAVQRTTAGRYPQEIHYPNGRKMEIGGPNIVVSRVGKPLWLYRLEGH